MFRFAIWELKINQSVANNDNETRELLEIIGEILNVFNPGSSILRGYKEFQFLFKKINDFELVWNYDVISIKQFCKLV